MRPRTLKRAVTLLVVLSSLLVACNPAEVAETTTTTDPAPDTTTTSLPPSTTTTTAPLIVDGAPPELVTAVDSFYDFAAGQGPAPLAADTVLAAIQPGEFTRPVRGIASVGQFQGEGLATVQVDGDLFLAVDDGNGWRIVGGNWPSIGVGPYYGPEPRLVAVIGSDARPGETITAKLADSIHVVGLDGVGGGGIVGVPRDSLVEGPADGRRKITTILATSGPDAFLKTLSGLSDLPLEGYVMTGFVGFQEMLGNVLGGVNIDVPRTIKDTASGANLASGEQYLNGPNALALARARKTLPGGDFDRSEHQGLIMIAAAQTVRSRGYTSIPTLLELSERWLETDLTPEQLLTFSALLIGSDLEGMVNTVVPGKPGMSGSAAVVHLSDAGADIWADLADGNLEAQ